MSADPQNPPKEGLDAARIGRRVGAAAFWVLCVWIIVTGSASVIRQIFFTPHDAAPQATDHR